ncbi:MAG TPA: lysophospholipid acyltransferase family protein [Bacteroidota bacterium]|nr:lysophospholipid acyltransferase family protein [Bacteroidota bacterium]
MILKHLIEYWFFLLLGFGVRLLPLRVVQRLGASAGELLYTLFGFRKAVAVDNLRRALPDLSEREIDQIACSSFRSVGTALFEFLWFPRFRPETIKEVARIENPELVKELHGRGKGIILLTAHFGNWELLAQSMHVELGLPLSIIVKPQSNPFVDRQINRWRTLWGNKVVPMGVAIREILRTLHEGGVVGIVADQSAPKESSAVQFFGRDVPTYEGPAVFSLKTGAPIMIGFAIRQPDGTYRSRFEEVPTRDLNGYSEANVLELTRRHVAITEKYIRAHPHLWMWMHKRWKHVQDSPTRA